MENTVAWWEPGISIKLPFSTPMGRAFGPRPMALQYVDNFHCVCPHILHIRFRSRESPGEVACGRKPGLNLKIDDAVRSRRRK